VARRKPPSFDFFPDDFMAGTYHLPAEVVGAYIRLLCYQWSNGSIPDDEAALSRIVGIDAAALRPHMLLLMQKFERGEDGGLRNHRLEDERAKKLSIIEKAKANANKRWAGKSQGSESKEQETGGPIKDATALPSHMPSHCEPICSQLPTSNVQVNSLSLSQGKDGLIDPNVICPSWLCVEFNRWLSFRFARDGQRIDPISQETMIQELVRRGEQKALKDINFSILKQAKRLLDSDNDYDKPMNNPGSGSGSSRYARKETAEESMKRLFNK